MLAAHRLLLNAPYDWTADRRAMASFIFGSTAPDTRVISGQPRESTHFFEIPLVPNTYSPITMMQTWPELADPTALEPRHAALVAGYLTHLVMDETWVEDVVLPCLFVAGETWGPEHVNWHVYNASIAYLDHQAIQALPQEIIKQTEEADIADVLPFIDNEPLLRWQMYVSQRLSADQVRSVGHAAENCGMTAEEMLALITSEEAMAREVYPVVAKEHLEAFQRDTTVRMQQAVTDYFNGAFKQHERDQA